MKIFLEKTRQKGQTLLEVMIALGVATVIISALVVIVLASLKNEEFGTSQNQATQFAQEGLDVMRNVSQTDWNKILAYSTTNYCLGNYDTVLRIPQTCTTPDNPNISVDGKNKFIREIKVELRGCDPSPVPPTITNARVTSTVRWTDSNCTTGIYCHKVLLATCLFQQ